MNKKILIALAARIAEIESVSARVEAARAVAEVAKQVNPLFDMARFLSACKANLPACNID